MAMKPDTSDTPSKNAIQEARQIPDEALTTSDSFIAEPAEPDAKPKKQDPPAAATDDKSSTKDQDPAPGTEDDKQDPNGKRRDRRAERRIKNLQKQLTQATQAGDESKRKLAQREAEIEALKQQVTKKPEPTLDDFKSPQEYAKAYAAWEKSQTSSKSPDNKPDAKKQPAEPAAPAVTPPDPEDIEDFRARGIAELGDRFLAAESVEEQAISQTMGEFCLDSDHGPELYAYLLENHDEALSIFDSSPQRAARMLKQLEKDAAAGTLLGDAPETKPAGKDAKDDKPASKVKATKAPKPPGDTTIIGSSKGAKDPEDETTEEYMVRRQRERKRSML